MADIDGLRTRPAPRPTVHARHLIPTGALTLALLAAAGCAAEEPPAPQPTVTPGGFTADGLTAPGTALEIGDTAMVPVPDSNGIAAFTITSVERGAVADFDTLRRRDLLDLGEAAPTPYYVRVEIEWLSGGRPVLLAATHLNMWAGRTFMQGLRPDVFHQTPPCTTQTFGPSAPTGSTVETCVTFLREPDQGAPDRITFSTDQGDGYWLPDDDELTWAL